jgi:hypothetical protein
MPRKTVASQLPEQAGVDGRKPDGSRVRDAATEFATYIYFAIPRVKPDSPRLSALADRDHLDPRESRIHEPAGNMIEFHDIAVGQPIGSQARYRRFWSNSMELIV